MRAGPGLSWVGAGLLAGVVTAGQTSLAQPAPPLALSHATEKADTSRLPVFHTSDPTYDAFLNDYFQRTLSIDERGIYLGGGPILFATDHMWVIDWDRFLFPWIDRGAMGRWRQGGSRVDVILTTLLSVPVTEVGHVWGGQLRPEANNANSHYIPLFGWPWPKFERNYSTKTPTGWNFNDEADGARPLWTAHGITLDPGYVDHRLVGTVTGTEPMLLSPEFDTEAFQAPVIELDIEYTLPAGAAGTASLVNLLKVSWRTDGTETFDESRQVDPSFADLPPAKYPQVYAPFISPTQARYVFYLPMCQHAEWGRGSTRIRRLRLAFGALPEGTRIAINYVRTAYDTRYSNNGSILIDATWRAYAWSGDVAFLRTQLPRARRAMLFLNEHLRGREQGLIDNSWFVGHDGEEGMHPGHSVPTAYWDLMPQGRYDLDACLAYWQALGAMAHLERSATRLGIRVEPVSVMAPDGRSNLAYSCTAAELDALAQRVRARIEEVFWNPDTGRFGRSTDAAGHLKDYGFLHANLMLLACGLGTEAQRHSILSWVDGSRLVPGDTAVGKDIYHWRFAPRITTKRNTDYYYWAWIWERQRDPDNPQFAWGNQMQDGGAVPFTSFFDLMARTRSGRQDEINAAFERTREVQAWFADVKATGGKGRDFYRAYYDGHPERGLQQSPNAGGLGLDREFLSDAALGAAFLPTAFLGISTPEDGVLGLAPCVPSSLTRLGMENLFYRGNHIAIEAGHDYLSLAGSRLPHAEGLQLRVMLPPGSTEAHILGRNATQQSLMSKTIGNRITVQMPLTASRIEWRRQAQ